MTSGLRNLSGSFMSYDMCVDAAVLEELAVSLKQIQNHLELTVDEMKYAIIEGGDFLEGRQFDRAKEITYSCVAATAKTRTNITRVLKYLGELTEQVETYNSCKFSGGN